MIIAGLDESNRGEALGPIYVSIAWYNTEQLDLKETYGDSKRHNSSFFKNLFLNLEGLKIYHRTLAIPIEDIDKYNLNTLVTKNMKSLLEELKPNLAYVDSHYPDSLKLKKQLSCKDVDLIVCHRADKIYAITGLASLVALKTKKEEFMAYQSLYGVMGSGNLTDPLTISYIKRHYPRVPLLRKKWNLRSIFKS